MDNYIFGQFVEIPERLFHKSCYIQVKKKRLTLSLEDKAFDVCFHESVPRDAVDNLRTIIFLHDRDSTSKIWDEIGTMTLMSAMGWRALAFDLPEYGNTRGGQVCNKAAFMQAFIDGADALNPVIVSADVGGEYAIPFLLENSKTLSNKVRAFMPIAPADSQLFIGDIRTNDIDIPVITIYGSKDEDKGGSAARNMVGLRNQRRHLIKGAGQRCYVNESDEWHFLLYNIIRQLIKSENQYNTSI